MRLSTSTPTLWQQIKLQVIVLGIAIGLIALIVSFSGCDDPAPTPVSNPVHVSKIVKGKNQAEETSYEYKYNIWKGSFYHQPNIHTVYYLIYTDGSYENVDVGKFTVTNIGDTIK